MGRKKQDKISLEGFVFMDGKERKNPSESRLVYVGGTESAKRSYDILLGEFRKIDCRGPTVIVGPDAVYVFSDLRSKRFFEMILDREGIEYSNQKPKKNGTQERKIVSDGEFNDKCAQCGFIGDYNSVDEVIANDQAELDEIGGSFKEIGGRMIYLIDHIDNILEKQTNAWNSERSICIPEEQIEIVRLRPTKGFQICPYTGCEGGKSNRDYILRNTKSGKMTTINPMTAHLAREHSLLEKGNKYGITAKEFYEHFMSE